MTRILQFSKRNSRKGSVLIMGTLTMTVLFGFMGLALDMSYMYFHKRRMQTAADAGALAGAQEILRGNANSAIIASAKNDSALDGFTDAANGVTVTVNNPPISGASAGNNRFVEVIVSQAQPTWFMRVLNVNSATVAARAVAGTGPGQACVYTLNPNLGNNNGFFINGTAAANFACGIYSNSNFRAVGGGCVTAPSVSYVGSYSDTGCVTPTVSQGIQVVDPLKGKYTIPAAAACVPGNTNQSWNPPVGTTIHISPGTYCSGMNLRGQGNIVFDAGTYIIDGGGLTVTAGVSVTGAGVTFFDTFDNSHPYGEVKITGTGLVTLSAPTAGPYMGLLFYQNPAVTGTPSNGSIIAGSASSSYQGIIYFPTTNLDYTGNSSTTLGGTDGYTLLIGYNITVRGTSSVNANYAAIGGISPLPVAQFTE